MLGFYLFNRKLALRNGMPVFLKKERLGVPKITLYYNYTQDDENGWYLGDEWNSSTAWARSFGKGDDFPWPPQCPGHPGGGDPAASSKSASESPRPRPASPASVAARGGDGERDHSPPFDTG